MRTPALSLKRSLARRVAGILTVMVAAGSHAQTQSTSTEALMPPAVVYAPKAVLKSGAELVASFDDKPRAMTFLPDGTMLLSIQRLSKFEPAIASLKTNGRLAAFPEASVDVVTGELQRQVNNVVSLQATQDRVTVVSAEAQTTFTTLKFFSYDIPQKKLMPPLTVEAPRSLQQLQDIQLALDEPENLAYLTDLNLEFLSGTIAPTILRIDYRRGTAARILEAGRDTLPRDVRPGNTVPDGVVLNKDRQTTFTQYAGRDPIAVDGNREWLYFAKPATGAVFKVPVKLLSDRSLSDARLLKAVQHCGKASPFGSMAADNAGRVYTLSSTGPEVGVLESGVYATLTSDSIINNPRCPVLGPDGNLYFIVNLRPLVAELEGKDARMYGIVRVHGKR